MVRPGPFPWGGQGRGPRSHKPRAFSFVERMVEQIIAVMLEAGSWGLACWLLHSAIMWPGPKLSVMRPHWYLPHRASVIINWVAMSTAIVVSTLQSLSLSANKAQCHKRGPGLTVRCVWVHISEQSHDLAELQFPSLLKQDNIVPTSEHVESTWDEVPGVDGPWLLFVEWASLWVVACGHVFPQTPPDMYF